MKLSLQGIQDASYREHGYLLPAFDIGRMRKNTAQRPTWLHFGAGNILRAFPCVLCQRLLERGDVDTGVVVVESYDEEIIDKAFTPYDDLCLAVSLRGDGTVEKRVVASVAEAHAYSRDEARVRQIMCADSLQWVTMTITEKGYRVLDAAGQPLPFCAGDFVSPQKPVSIMGVLCKLLLARYEAGARPVAMVSLDNCSHNGTILHDGVLAIASAWVREGVAPQGLLTYLEERCSFTWSMIDKITPRPADEVCRMLEADGFEDANSVVTSKGSYVSAMVNAEECEYLAIEDAFPNARPSLEHVGVIMTDRATVDRIEKMKVCTCLNPLHTALAIFGCLLGYTRISDEMKDAALSGLVRHIGYDEGLPVAVDPGVMSARDFLDAVLERRFPNPFVPDTPQRIACDTSQKLPVRFGETLKAYIARGRSDLSFLRFIPLVFAAYARYLTSIGDDGKPFACSPDPNLSAMTALVAGFALGEPFDTHRLRPLFSDASVFGVDLYACGLGERCEALFAEMSKAPGAIRAALEQRVLLRKSPERSVLL